MTDKGSVRNKTNYSGFGDWELLDKGSVVWEYTSELATKLAQSTIADRSQVQMKRKPDGFPPPVVITGSCIRRAIYDHCSFAIAFSPLHFP
jgi:hypothetical protein